MMDDLDYVRKWLQEYDEDESTDNNFRLKQAIFHLLKYLEKSEGK